MAVGKAISASPMVVGEVSRKPLSGMEVEPQRFLCRWERRTRPVCWILAWDPAKAQPASNTKATQLVANNLVKNELTAQTVGRQVGDEEGDHRVAPIEHVVVRT
uniref:Uncharacterized protein n=1 Tax=Oryza punctata TaxID=4537 RepID=A0A0E0JNJ9_ORYPU